MSGREKRGASEKNSSLWPGRVRLPPLRGHSAFFPAPPPFLSPPLRSLSITMAPGLKRSILGMGNPLLDIIADVDDAFLAKYEVSKEAPRFFWCCCCCPPDLERFCVRPAPRIGDRSARSAARPPPRSMWPSQYLSCPGMWWSRRELVGSAKRRARQQARGRVRVFFFLLGRRFFNALRLVSPYTPIHVRPPPPRPPNHPQIKLADQILAEDKHAPMFEVRDGERRERERERGRPARALAPPALTLPSLSPPPVQELAAAKGVQYVPGGATQNTIRIAQWMLQVPGATAYMGCVGDDAFAKTMEAAAKADGVDVRYFVDPATPSGTCAVAVKGGERSLVANLAAANNYKVREARRGERESGRRGGKGRGKSGHHSSACACEKKLHDKKKNTPLSVPHSFFQASHAKEPANWALVEDASIIYSAGFFITVSPDAIAAAAEHCSSNNKIYAMNLSAPFISQVPPFKATLMATMPHIDVLFGNETEARAFAESEGWETECLATIAAKIAAFPKANGTRGRTVVITQGADPTVVASEGRILSVPVTRLAPEKLVDTNGAGDAFVGGFLSQLAAGKGPLECCRAGNFAAHFIIQRSGVTLPAEAPAFEWA